MIFPRHTMLIFRKFAKLASHVRHYVGRALCPHVISMALTVWFCLAPGRKGVHLARKPRGSWAILQILPACLTGVQGSAALICMMTLPGPPKSRQPQAPDSLESRGRWHLPSWALLAVGPCGCRIPPAQILVRGSRLGRTLRFVRLPWKQPARRAPIAIGCIKLWRF